MSQVAQMTSPVFGAESVVLGATPIKTTTTLRMRKRLFSPASAPAVFATPALTPPSTPISVTIATEQGTLVQYKVPETNPRGNTLGVLMSRTTATSSTVDVVWTDDGSKEAIVLPF